MSSCSSSPIYQSQIEAQADLVNPAVIVVVIFLPIQIGFVVFVFVSGYKKYKQQIAKKRKVFKSSRSIFAAKPKDRSANPLQANIDHTEVNMMRREVSEGDGQVEVKEARLQCLEWVDRILYEGADRVPIFYAALVVSIIMALTFVFLLMGVLAVYQAADHVYSDSECLLRQKIGELQQGSTDWVGLENLIPNVTKLNLVLNTRTEVSIKAVQGLLLNGTATTPQLAIGFRNGSVIPFNTSTGAVSTVTTTNVSSYIEAALRQYLFRNTSLSNGNEFPICQGSTSTLIQHPSLTGQQVELNYMDTICTALTSEVDTLVANGQKVDELLIELLAVNSSSATIEGNLSALNDTYSPIAIRSNEYSLQVSTMGQDLQLVRALPITGFMIFSGVLAVQIVYFIYGFWSACCCCTCECDCDENDETSSESRSPEESGKTRFEQIPFKFSKSLLISLVIVNLIVAASLCVYLAASKFSRESCEQFEQAKVNSTIFSSLGLSTEQAELLAPLQECTSGQNSFFMQTTSMLSAHPHIQALFSISQTYNASIPIDLFDTLSLSEIQVMKGYLSDLNTIPIKSTTLNVSSIVEEISQYSNGSHINSQQKAECGSAVIQDEYVFNARDCSFRHMDLINELSTTEPRCIIIPAYNGTPGTSTTDLNEAQHNFILNTSCPSITDMFDPTNTNCFLNQRLQLLNAAGCTNTAAELGTRLQNLVQFSKEASQYTDVYMQNLRNFFGVYAVMNSNLTEFLVGTNMSSLLDDYGVLSNNLLNRTLCSEISSKVNQVFNSYCPSESTLSMLFYDAFIWSVLAMVLIVLESVLFYFLDVMFRVYRLNKHFSKIGDLPQREIQAEDTEIRIKGLGSNTVNRHQENRMQISEQTLRREIDNEQDEEEIRRKILQNQFQLIKEEELARTPQENQQHVNNRVSFHEPETIAVKTPTSQKKPTVEFDFDNYDKNTKFSAENYDDELIVARSSSRGTKKTKNINPIFHDSEDSDYKEPQVEISAFKVKDVHRRPGKKTKKLTLYQEAINDQKQSDRNHDHGWEHSPSKMPENVTDKKISLQKSKKDVLQIHEYSSQEGQTGQDIQTINFKMDGLTGRRRVSQPKKGSKTSR